MDKDAWGSGHEVWGSGNLVRWELETHKTSKANPVSNNPKFNSLPNGKILDWSKLKAFADDNINFFLK